MDRIRYFAEVSVTRACGFALLGIVTVVLGLSHDLVLAMRSAAILLSLMMMILIHFGWRAPYTDYRRRELWILLDQWHGLPEHRAHQTISGVMRDTFMRNAERCAWLAVGCWGVSFSESALA